MSVGSTKRNYECYLYYVRCDLVGRGDVGSPACVRAPAEHIALITEA